MVHKSKKKMVVMCGECMKEFETSKKVGDRVSCPYCDDEKEIAEENVSYRY